jgi:putative DNA primase/helicase
MNPHEFFPPSDKYQPIPDLTQLELPPGGQYYTNGHTGVSYVRWPAPVPGPETVIDKRTGKSQVVPLQEELASAGQEASSESKPEPVNPSYVEAVTPEEEEQYSKAAIFAQEEAQYDEDQEQDWTQVLRAAIVMGDAIGRVVLPSRQPIIADWFNEGDYALNFAPRGLGKTWMNLGLAVAICTGTKFGPYASLVDWPVLYLDGEMPFDLMKNRILALHGSFPQKLAFLNHEVLFQQGQKTMNLTGSKIQEAVTAFCLDCGIRVVFVDNLSCLFGGLKENEADAWEPVKSWLLTMRRHRIAVIVIHHTGRDPKNMRGTSRREDDAFWILRLEEPSDVIHREGARFVTRFTKCRGAAAEPLAYDWRIEPQPGGRVLVTFKESNSDDVIVAWVRDGVCSATDIADAMGLHKASVSRRAARLIEVGRLEKHGREYALGPVEEKDWSEARDWTK